MIERPEAIIITVSGRTIRINGGLSGFIRQFKYLIESDHGYVWNMSSKPKYDPLHVFICIGNRIRYRCNFVGYEEPHSMYDGRFKTTMRLTGPLINAPSRIEYKGFQGFRYTHKLF